MQQFDFIGRRRQGGTEIVPEYGKPPLTQFNKSKLFFLSFCMKFGFLCGL
jgi:hypothetical protein